MKYFFSIIPLFLLFSCSDDSRLIKTYQIPKEKQALSINLPFSWEKPPSWRSQTPGELKKAQFHFSYNGLNAEAFLVYVEGKSGSLEDNINRWRRQIGLKPIKPNDIELKSMKTPLGNLTLYTCENNETKEGSKVAYWEDHKGKWFFKMTGNIKVIENETENFFLFLHSMKSQ